MSDIYDYLSFFFPCFSLTNIPCSSFSPCFWRHPRPDSWGIVLISNAPRADCHGPWQPGTVPGDSSAFSRRPCGESAWPRAGSVGMIDGQSRGAISATKNQQRFPGDWSIDFTWFYRLGIFAILLGIEPKMWPNFGGPIKGRMGVFFYTVLPTPWQEVGYIPLPFFQDTIGTLLHFWSVSIRNMLRHTTFVPVSPMSDPETALYTPQLRQSIVESHSQRNTVGCVWK